jgi:iduronate 2-sulfatase
MEKPNTTKFVIVLFLAFTLLGFAGIASAADPQLNVLFLAIDDMKPLLGCYGDEVAITPYIDSLADGGVTFLNAHCQFAVCGPSRASLTSSLMPEETGVTSFKALRYKLPDLITLPQHFKNNGYETAAIGKIHDFRTVGD